MRIQLLGPVRVYAHLDEELPIGGPKQRAVLARLTIAPGCPASVDQLTEAVWGKKAPNAPTAHWPPTCPISERAQA